MPPSPPAPAQVGFEFRQQQVDGIVANQLQTFSHLGGGLGDFSPELAPGFLTPIVNLCVSVRCPRPPG